MKTVLLAAAAFALMGSAAVAQDYPPCTHPGQDHCVQGPGAREGEHMVRHHWRHHMVVRHHHWRHHHRRHHHH